MSETRPSPAVVSAAVPCAHRQVVYRVLPGSAARARRLASIAGACRFVWNELLDQQDQCRGEDVRRAGPEPAFTLGKARRATPWLEAMPAPVRSCSSTRTSAWKRFLFKSDSALRTTSVSRAGAVPKLGWTLRRRGGNPYPDGRPVQAVVKRVGRRWLATVCYEVEAVPRPDDGRVLGVDRNAGQVAVADDQTSRIVAAPKRGSLEARRRRYQRRMARQRRGSSRRARTRRRFARTERKLATRRRNWCHHVSRSLATDTLMCRECRGGVPCSWPWMCSHVDAKSRVAQALFRCTACGHRDHADLNAARNIRRRGLAQLHGEERSATKQTPVTREMDRRCAA